MRSSLPAACGLLVGCLVASFACGGASSQEVLDGTSSSSGSSSSSTPTPSSTGTSSPPSSSGGTTTDASAPDASGSCTTEKEPNDGKDQATTLAPTVCGAIEPQDDVDVLTFTLQPTTKNVSLKFDGQVTLKVDVEGAASVTLGGTNGFPPLPFVKNKPYFVEIRPTVRAAKVPWQVTLIEK